MIRPGSRCSYQTSFHPYGTEAISLDFPKMPAKSVLITGCSAGGIGAELALAFSKRGLHVFATARNTQKLPEELASLSNVTVIQLDVTSTKSVADALEIVKESGKGLDILVNNAGAGYAMPLLDVDITEAQKLYETNLWGPLRMIQAFAGLLIESRGQLVNVSTVGSLLNTPWIGTSVPPPIPKLLPINPDLTSATYASSKSALNTLSETLRLELSPFGVSVTTVITGTVKTKFHVNDTVYAVHDGAQELPLPAGSWYELIKDIIATWANGASNPKGCPADEFAETLATRLLGREGRKGGKLYEGNLSGVIKFVTNWLPTFVVVSGDRLSSIIC